MRVEFLTYVLTGLGLAAAIHYTYISIVSYQDQIMSVSGCVSDHWREYEDRTGQMPSVEVEESWHRDCLRVVK